MPGSRRVAEYLVPPIGRQDIRRHLSFPQACIWGASKFPMALIGKIGIHYQIIEQIGAAGMSPLQCKTAACSDYTPL